MKPEQLSKYLNMDIADLVRQLRRPHAGEGDGEVREATSGEAALRIVARDDRTLDFYSTLGASRLFSIAAQLGGSLEIFAQHEVGQGRRITLSVPVVDAEGTRQNVKVSYSRPQDGPSQELDVLRASCARVPPATQMLEVVFGRDNAEYRYVFEMSAVLEVADFQEIADHRPLFTTTPPVSQMSAFLRAITQQRRDLTRILEDIAQSSGSPSTCETLTFLLRYYRSHSHEAGRMVAALERVMEESERKIAAPTLGAVCLFIDMERGALTAQGISHAAESGDALEISPLAALATATHFGVHVDATTWSRYFAFSQVDFEQLQRELTSPEVQQILIGLHSQQGGRTTLQVLQDLARESKSARVDAFVAHLANRLQDGQFEANDVQRVLLALLESNGRPVRPSTLTALCLFVDVEVGHVTEERIEEVAAASVDSSIYSMVAVAGAFDVGLRGFLLEGLSRDPERYLSAFLKLAEDGVLVACRRIGGEGRWWRWLRTRDDLHKAEADQLEFTGEVLGSFPVLDQLDEADLEACLASGATCLVRFRSAQDGTFMWHKMDQAFYDAHVRDYEALVEGFTAYHYVRTIIGEVVQQPSAERHSVTVYADSRGKPHFRYDASDAPEGMEHTGQRVSLADVTFMPEMVMELRQEHLLGRPEPMAAEINTLYHIHSALHHVLTRDNEQGLLADHPDFSERVLKAWMEHVEAAVAPMVRVSVLNRFVDVLEPDSRHEWHVLRALLDCGDVPEVAELTALRMVRELLREAAAEAEPPAVQAVRKMMLERLSNMLHHEKALLRATGVRLLATQELNRDANASELAEYEVRRLLGDSDSSVSRAAAETLAHLGLRSVVPLPAMLSLRKRQASGRSHKVREAGEAARIKALCADLEHLRPGLGRNGALWAADTIVAFYRATTETNLLQRPRLLTLVPATRLETLRIAVLETWRVLALVMATPLAELIDTLETSDLFHELRILIMERSDELTQVLGAAPFLADMMTVYRMEPGDPLDLWHQGQASLSDATVKASPFLRALLEAAPKPTHRGPQVLRLVGEAERSLLDALSDSTATLKVQIDSSDLQVLSSNGHLEPLLAPGSIPHDRVGHGEREWDDFEALCSLYRVHHLEGAARERRAATSAPAGLHDLASALARTFGLSQDYHRQLHTMLLGIAPYALYDLTTVGESPVSASS